MRTQSKITARSRAQKAPWAIPLFAFFALEAALFYWTVVRSVAPYYPIDNDQISYFLTTYRLIRQGWAAIGAEFFNGTHATGVGFTALGAAFGLLFGESRIIILSLNLVCLLALQLVQFRTVLAQTQEVAIAWLSIALLISSQALFNGAGGLYDFRIDFAALCLYGIWVYSILWSEVFYNIRRSLLVIPTTFLLVSFRYLTAVYVASLMGILFAAFVLAVMRPKRADSKRALRLRISNLVLVGTLSALLLGPLLFLSRHEIYNYYVVGHVVGEEKYIRAQMLGLFTFADHLLYYPISLYRDQLGPLFVLLTAVSVIISSAFVCSLRVARDGLIGYRLEFSVLALAIAIPLAALTLDISKSPVVGGIVVAPVVGLACLFCSAMWEKRTSKWDERPHSLLAFFRDSRAVRLLGVASVVVIALATYTSRSLKTPINHSPNDLRNITEINEVIDRYLIQSSRPQPTISFDRVTDYLNWGTVVLFGFENYHQIIDLSPRFGHSIYGIFAVPREVAFKLFEESDVIVLTDPVLGRTGYPNDQTIREYWNELKAWTKDHRALLYSKIIFGVPHEVYVRQSVPTADTK